MKIAVMGAGAVGCYYGALLARAGHDVVLVGRRPLVDAVRDHGLHLESAAFQGFVALRASADASAVAGAGIVLFCVKSTDTESAGHAISPHLGPGVRVLSLQNGADNASRLQQILGRKVEPAVVYVAAEMRGPGRVKHHGRGELVVSPGALQDAEFRQFIEAGIPIQASDNVPLALWSKLVLNCAYNALSAIARVPYGRLAAGDGVLDVMRTVVDECIAVARLDGVVIPGTIWDDVLRIARTMPSQFSSTAQDIMRGKRSEIDHLNGYVVRRGAAGGVAAPVNAALYAIVKLLESGGTSTAAPTAG
ncbi:MAG TPA: 2-dehydropantoate 2-reductase [Burkholderiaceae bacterium]|nr:2-dehydropantoate 2-reductase [Burkholderiaceae bacterium]